MNMKKKNPFDITKAVDLSDEQINDYWVDYVGDGGFEGFVKPTSPMPMLIKGGKGSGKTHIMRYFSYPAQKQRYKEGFLDRMATDGYIGIYTLLGNMNSLRFRDGGKDESYWASLFSYYMDLWLSQVVLNVVADLVSSNADLEVDESNVCEEILAILSPNTDLTATTLFELTKVFQVLQHEVDGVVNNRAIGGADDLVIRSTPGRLVFEIPKIISQHIAELRGVQFLYLIDELENLLEYQQKYVNTLVRHRESPCSIKIGSRLYGVKTLETLSAGEVNREGSEFELFIIDSQLREKSRKKAYSQFSKDLCLKRVVEAGYSCSSEDKDLWNKFFFTYDKDPFLTADTEFVIKKYAGLERPYLEALRKNLMKGMESKTTAGVSNEGDVEQIINNIMFPNHPLLEKACILLLYKSWSNKKTNLLGESFTIKELGEKYIESPTVNGRIKTVIGHFKFDLLAQLLRESGQKQRYLGMDTFIDMSSALPRHLLMILKHVYQWARFSGEQPFETGNKISIASQQKGVLEASDWFYKNAGMTGEDAQDITNSIDRIATLLRSLRYSDKPSECSLSSFSVDHTKISKRALSILNQAENYSLLIRVGGGQRDRNSERIDSKYQLNPMLCPRWDLPVARRGAIALNSDEANAIFDQNYSDHFEILLKERVSRMMAPFLAKKRQGDKQAVQGDLI